MSEACCGLYGAYDKASQAPDADDRCNKEVNKLGALQRRGVDGSGEKLCNLNAHLVHPSGQLTNRREQPRAEASDRLL